MLATLQIPHMIANSNNGMRCNCAHFIVEKADSENQVTCLGQMAMEVAELNLKLQNPSFFHSTHHMPTG